MLTMLLSHFDWQMPVAVPDYVFHVAGPGADGRRTCRAESRGQGFIQSPDHGLFISRHTGGH